ncbi:glycoside hydrolase family 29 protein [Astrocystis sublimbata]|nr:glycoside hydrolase family 29 protein [Astrocystis sublimbata]
MQIGHSMEKRTFTSLRTPSSLKCSTPLDISAHFNNKAFGKSPDEASFDRLGQAFPPPRSADTPYYTSSKSGIAYDFPGYTGPEEPDNVICEGQTIAIPQHAARQFFSASFLVSGDVEAATATGNVTFAYSDGSTSSYELRALSWFSFLAINRGELIFPFRFTKTGVNWNSTHVFEHTAPLDPEKSLVAVILPDAAGADDVRLHVFAVSLWGSDGGCDVQIQAVRPTQKWFDAGEQVVEVTVNNAGQRCVAGSGMAIRITGEGFTTTREGKVKRLCPGDQKVAKVGVKGVSKGPAEVELVVEHDFSQQVTQFSDVEIGLTGWTAELDNLARHEAPDWFDASKYGILIHWGVYAVTGWGNSTPHERFAEWFWWYSNHHPEADPADFYDYRLRTYGRDWAYDDTFTQFTASRYDPKAWVDLFADAGAQYFVITGKHHDGFALFDTGHTSNRSSLHYGPKRDLFRELFDAARTHQPHLRRGAYLSLAEWYHPDFAPYAFDRAPVESSVSGTDAFSGELARNPYTGATEPYTGYIPVDDFVADLMLPQMRTLANDYAADIMWCDIGAANATAVFAAEWWNATRAQGRQVAVNSRCGLAQAADFDTPEYATFSSAQARKWESNMGMDPFSYGYNGATPAGEYMNASSVVHTLVDVVAKNGNLLLDIGPRADGTIVEAEVDSLLAAGRWIRSHGEAIFNTTYWFVQSEVIGEGLDVRFTQTDGAFYVLFLERPVVDNGVVRLPAPLPILEGDKISMVAVEGALNLAWNSSCEGGQKVLHIAVDDGLLEQDHFCWVFKISYR